MFERLRRLLGRKPESLFAPGELEEMRKWCTTVRGQFLRGRALELVPILPESITRLGLHNALTVSFTMDELNAALVGLEREGVIVITSSRQASRGQPNLFDAISIKPAPTAA